MPAAYFDVDGTLVGGNLLPPTLMYLANQASPLDSAWRVARLFADAPRLAAEELKDRRLFNERLFWHFRGMTDDRLRSLAGDVYNEQVKPKLFRGVRSLVNRCQDAGMRVVLVTGSLDITMEPLRRDLGADACIANRLEIKDHLATGRLLRPVVAGPYKSRLIVEDAERHGDDLAACHAYSDSYSDVPMLSVVGHPYCINPDRRLAQLAQAYDWPIIDIQSGP